MGDLSTAAASLILTLFHLSRSDSSLTRKVRKLHLTTEAAFCRGCVCSFPHYWRRSMMDGHRELENPLSLLQWLGGWAVILGTCTVFWLTVYRWAVE